MGQAKQRGSKQQRIEQAKVIAITCCTEDLSNINFEDVDVGYEDFAQALRRAKFDWTAVKRHNINVSVKYEGYESAFKLDKTQTCANGRPLIEFAVNAGLWQGINLCLVAAHKHSNNPALQAQQMRVIGNQLQVILS